MGGNSLGTSQIWVTKDWVLLHENAPAHWFLLMQQQLTKRGTVVFSSSTKIAQSHNFYLFLQMKNQLKVCHFKGAMELEVCEILGFHGSEDDDVLLGFGTM
jgi:hypothetical protein